MTAAVLTHALLGVLAVVMAGLGLSLTVDDFRRLREHPLAAVLAIAKQSEALMGAAAELGGAVLAFNLLSLAAGYGLGRAVRLPRPLCIAIGYEVGIHNSTLALYLALGVLQQFPVALPAALYSVSMYVTALLFGFWLRRSG